MSKEKDKEVKNDANKTNDSGLMKKAEKAAHGSVQHGEGTVGKLVSQISRWKSCIYTRASVQQMAPPLLGST